MPSTTFVLALALLAVGALAGSEDRASEMTWTSVDLDSLDFTTTPSGLQYYDIHVGTGSELSRGDQATVMYKLYLGPTRGRHVYSQATEREAFSLRVGAGQVIKGFDEAVASMRVGTQRVAIMSADIAYGKHGMSSFGIPGDATLLYFLEVVNAQVRDL